MTGPSRALAPVVLYAAVAAIHVIARFLEHPLDGPTKLLIMPALAVGVLWASAGIRPWPRGAIAMLLLAILLSWLGDGAATFFPMFDDELPMMLLCFGLAHVAYILLMLRGRRIAMVRTSPSVIIGYAAAYIGLMVLLLPRAGALAVPVAIYGLLLVATATVASRCRAVIGWGGFWFLVSDAILSLRIFLPEVMPAWTSAAVMLTYALGQGLLAFGIVAALRRREEPRLVAHGRAQV